MVKVGIDTRIFKYYDVEYAISKISKFFKIVEVCATHIKRLERSCLTIGDIGNILNRLRKDYGVDIAQIHAPYGDIDELLTYPSEREHAISRILKYVELCNIVECPVLVMHVPYRRPMSNESYIDFIRCLENSTRYLMRRLDNLLRSYSVKIAFENRLEQCFGCIPDDIIKIISEEGVENFGICIDTGHANVNKLNIEDIVKRFHRYIIATHVHDNDGIQDRHMPPMMGTINWRGIIDVFRRYCRDVPLILEVEPICDKCCENMLELCYTIITRLVS